MANLPRPPSDKRPFSIFLPIGTPIGMVTEKGPVYGFVSHLDEGNWIYPRFTEGARMTVLPSWCRASQVFIDDRKNTQLPLPGK